MFKSNGKPEIHDCKSFFKFCFDVFWPFLLLPAIYALVCITDCKLKGLI